MTLQEASTKFRTALKGVYDSREASMMFRIVAEELLHCSTTDMLLRAGEEIPDFVARHFQEIAKRLLMHEPLQYILGKARFHGMTLKVNRHTLIPRPETEQLVDMIVDENRAADLRVIDVGTGSGCIAIALARCLLFPHVTAVDVSADALAVARENARQLKVKVDFVQADVFKMAQQPPSGTLDVVVSNPPYVCCDEKPFMERNVLDYEPATALFVPDGDPLRYYRAIAVYAASALACGGKLYLEINSRFGNEVKRLMEQHGFVDCRIALDSFGKQRFAAAVKPDD